MKCVSESSQEDNLLWQIKAALAVKIVQNHINGGKKMKILF